MLFMEMDLKIMVAKLRALPPQKRRSVVDLLLRATEIILQEDRFSSSPSVLPPNPPFPAPRRGNLN